MNIAILAFLAASAIRPGGDMRDVSMRPPSGVAADTLTIDAMPYARTVTCGSYTLTGSYTGSAPTGWTASPSGESGACSDLGAGSFSCVVAVSPDASGEGVETITVGTDSVEIGFYVAGAHSCFLSQSVDGSYNSTLSDLDAVATWENLGSSALDVTQGTGTAQPTFRTSIVGGQPVVRCDGGDRVAAATTADWDFMSDLSTYTVDLVAGYPADTNTYGFVAATGNGTIGSFVGLDYRTATTRQAFGYGVSRAEINENAVGTFFLLSAVYANTAGVDGTLIQNGGSSATFSGSASTSASSALVLCGAASTFPFTGDIFRVVIYQSALSSTQRGINEAVDEWALGGTLPVTPPILHLDSSYLASVTTAGGAVSSWYSTGSLTISAVTGSYTTPDHTGSGSTAQVDFDGAIDGLSVSATLSPSASSWHAIAVITPGAVTSNDATCYRNNTVVHDTGPYRSIYLRNNSGAYTVGAYNWDGTADCVEAAISGVGDIVIVDASLSGGNLGIGVNGGSLTAVASGNTTTSPTSTAIGGFGAGGVTAYDGIVHEIFWYPAALSSGDRTALIDSLKSKWGIP